MVTNLSRPADVTAVRHEPFVIGVIALLMLSHALPYYWATVTLDTARDLTAALQIGRGEAIARGPILNGLFHLGPIWFYVLAPVLVITKSQALTLLWIGLLAALKFPLAYLLGTRLRDRSLGLTWAVLLALPSWSSIGAIFPTHTAMVEAAVLLQMHLMLKLAHEESIWNWAWLGLAVGLALHAHPTAILVLVALPAVFWARRLHWDATEVAPMLIGVILFAVPLIPILIAEGTQGWPALQPTLDYVHGDDRQFGSFAALSILSGTFLVGPIVVLELMGRGPFVEVALGLTAAFVLLALIGMLRRGAAFERRMFLLGLAALVLVSILLAWLRDYTPFYMTLVLLPLGAGLLALGVSSLPAPRVWVALATMPALAGSAILIASANAGHAEIDVARLANVQNATTVRVVDAALLPAWQLDGIGRELCKASTPVVLHGYLAVLYDSALAVGPKLHCPDRAPVTLAGPGSADAQHWLGLPPALEVQFGLQRYGRWTQTPRTGVQALWPPKSLKAADPTHYPHHRASAELASPQTWRITSQIGRALITTDMLYPYRVNRVDRVLANDVPARKLAQANITAVWVCDSCSGPEIQWEVQGTGNDPSVLDIVSVVLPIYAPTDAGQNSP